MIIATTSIWADILHNVTCEGQLAQVESLIPPGADPHAYEPSLADRGRLGEAALIVANGLGLETGLAGTLTSVAEDGTPVLYVGDHIGDMSLPFVEEDDHGEDAGHDHSDEEGHDHADEDHTEEEGHDHDKDEDHDHDEDEDHSNDDHDEDEDHEDDHADEDHTEDDDHDHDEDEDHSNDDHADEDHTEDDDHDHDKDEDHSNDDHADEDHTEDDDHADEEGHEHDDDEDHADEDHSEDDHAEDADHSEEDHTEDDDHDHDADDDHADHDHGPIDPHIWLDPLLVAESLEEISEVLELEAGLDQSSLTPCVNDYETALHNLHEELVDILSEVPPERRKLITNHDAFGYFASRYDFDVVGYVLGLSTLAEPSAARLPELGELLDETSLPAVFDEHLSVPSDTLKNLVDGRQGVQIATLYTGALGAPDSDAATYLGMLRSNAAVITSALSGS